MEPNAPELKYLAFEREANGVCHLRLNRPEKLNSWTQAMWSEFGAFGASIAEDDSIRALVISGNGRAFSSGIDTAAFATGLLNGDSPNPAAGSFPLMDEHPLTNLILNLASTYHWLADAAFPTIAAVHGYALGAGLQLALACDIRLFAHGTTVGLIEHQYGMLPDLGGTQRLPRVVGAAMAKYLIWSAAKIDDEEAFRIGLCQQRVPQEELIERALEIADRIASQPPLAVRGVKRVIQASSPTYDAASGAVEARQQTYCLESDDFSEAMMAFLEQRAPEYRGK